VVNNAGYHMSHEHIQELSLEELDHTFRTNVFATFLLSQAALKKLPAGGVILNTTSIQAYDPSPQLVAYAATKVAILSMTKSIADLAIKQGVRVNAVAPGPVWTPLIPSTMPAEKVKTFGSNTGFGRPAQPIGLAKIFVFLASDDASYVTGEVYGATGGRTPYQARSVRNSIALALITLLGFIAQREQKHHIRYLMAPEYLRMRNYLSARRPKSFFRKLQATGQDTRRRRQSCYHPRWQDVDKDGNSTRWIDGRPLSFPGLRRPDCCFVGIQQEDGFSEKRPPKRRPLPLNFSTFGKTFDGMLLSRQELQSREEPDWTVQEREQQEEERDQQGYR
jgi:hypothetical protein